MPPVKFRKKKTLQRKFVDLGMLLLLGAILVAAGVFSGVLGMRLAVSRAEVVVPSLVGETMEGAEKLLSAKSLNVHVQGERYDDRYEPGTVISQSPKAGGSLKTDRSVQVIVSLGKRTHPVPNLVGNPLRVAELTAAQYNYEVGHVSRVFLSEVDQEQVILQTPEAGLEDVTNPKIDILVSTGEPERFLMPDLLDQNLNKVKAFLEEQGFEVGTVVYRFYPDFRKGNVVRQFPEPGSLVTKKDKVNLEVSR
jgi:serine/threonine-protein kinase